MIRLSTYRCVANRFGAGQSFSGSQDMFLILILEYWLTASHSGVRFWCNFNDGKSLFDNPVVVPFINCRI